MPSGEERKVARSCRLLEPVDAARPEDPAGRAREAREHGSATLALSRRYRLGPVRATGGAASASCDAGHGMVTRLNATASIVLDAPRRGTPQAMRRVPWRGATPGSIAHGWRTTCLGWCARLTERGLVVPALAGAPVPAFTDSTPDLPDMNPGDTA